MVSTETGISLLSPHAVGEREIDIRLSNNQHLHRTWNAPKEELPHKRPFVGVSGCRSWSRSIAFEGIYGQKLTNLLGIDYSNTPTEGLTWLTHQLHTQVANQLRVCV